MSNQWFRFKKFTIHQDKCSMKVGTDGVILGAWTNITDTFTALDIGTGTGLLALMLAQRSTRIKIDAIEIDTDAANQARQNVSASSYRTQITVINHDFNAFLKEDAAIYDLIISNPPFFADSLKPGDQGRWLARHSDALSVEKILIASATILSPKGRLSFIFPYDILESVVKLAEENNLFPVRVLKIRPTPLKEYKRVCIEFSFVKSEIAYESIIIEDRGRHKYSDDYRNLTNAFYLNL